VYTGDDDNDANLGVVDSNELEDDIVDQELNRPEIDEALQKNAEVSICQSRCVYVSSYICCLCVFDGFLMFDIGREFRTKRPVQAAICFQTKCFTRQPLFVLLWSPYGTGQTTIFSSCGFFLSSIFFSLD